MQIELLHLRTVSYTVMMDNPCVADKSWIVTCLPSKMSVSSHAKFTSIIDIFGRCVWSSLRMSVPPLSNSALHSFLTHCNLVTPSPYTCIRWRWIWLGKYVLHIKSRWYSELPHWTKFSMSLPLHVKLSSEYHLTDWLLSICCMLSQLQSCLLTAKYNTWLTQR